MSQPPKTRRFSRLGRQMVRAGIAPRVKENPPEEQPIQPPRPTPVKFIHGEMPDTWEPRYRDEERVVPTPTRQPTIKKTVTTINKDKEQPLEVEENPQFPRTETGEDGYEVTNKRHVRMNRTKRRDMSMSISVSAEEEEIIRRYLATLNQTFSAWARSLIFRAIGRNPPARPK